MQMRILAAASALVIAAPIQAATAPVSYTISGADVENLAFSGTMILNFDSSQPFSTAYTLNSLNLTVDWTQTVNSSLGIQTLTNPFLNYSSLFNAYVFGGNFAGGTIGLWFNPSLLSQTAEVPDFEPGQPPHLVPVTGVFINELNGAVPEPATWGMMLLGFGVMAMALRRREPRRAARLA